MKEKTQKERKAPSKTAQELLDLWEEYCGSREGREAHVPDGFPVFNGTNFLYWLVDKYGKKG